MYLLTRIKSELFHAARGALLLSASVASLFDIALMVLTPGWSDPFYPPYVDLVNAAAYVPGYVPLVHSLSARGEMAPFLAMLLSLLPWSLMLTLLRATQHIKRAAASAGVRSASLVTPPASKTGIQIGPRLILPRSIEPLHVLALGGTGAGKSQVIRVAALAARRDGCPAVVPAVEAGLFESLYDPSCDTILCPYDTRGVMWSPLREIEYATDAAFLAAALIAEGSTGNAEEWRGYGRQLLSAFFLRAWEGSGSLGDVLAMFESPPAALMPLLAGTAAATMAREEAGRMLDSALSTASSAASALRDTENPETLTADTGWSITEWTRDQVERADKSERGGFLWILLPDRIRENMMPLATAAITIAARTILSSRENQDRRFYLFLDELDSLLPIAAISSALTRGRKYGLRCFVGVQSVSQLQQGNKYGIQGGQTLLSCLSSQVLFRTSDVESGEYVSKLIGDRHITRQTTSHSTSSGGGTPGSPGSSSTSTSESHTIERAVLPSEVAGLKNLRAYVRIAERASNVALTDIIYQKLPEAKHQYFEPQESVRRKPVTAAPAAPEPQAPAPGATSDPFTPAGIARSIAISAGALHGCSKCGQVFVGPSQAEEAYKVGNIRFTAGEFGKIFATRRAMTDAIQAAITSAPAGCACKEQAAQPVPVAVPTARQEAGKGKEFFS